MWQKIIKFSILALVFLMPIFWLPFTFEALEFNKVYLLFFFVSLGTLSWFGKMIFQDKEIRFRTGSLNLAVLVFLIVAILNIYLSIDKNASIFGFYGRFWPSLIGLLSLGGFYFLVTNNVDGQELKVRAAGQENSKKSVERPKTKPSNQTGSQDEKPLTINGILKVFLASSFFVVLMSYLSIFGVWQILNDNLVSINPKLVLPQIMLSRVFNTVSGSLEGLSMFLAFLIVFLVGKFAFLKKEKTSLLNKILFVFGYILLLASFLLLTIINFPPSWLVIFFSLFFFLVFSFAKRIFREDVNRLTLSILFLLISLFFVFFNPLKNTLQNNALLSGLPKEILLSQKLSWRVAFEALKEKPILGSGISTFSFIFSKFKPESFLKTQFWNLRFDRGTSYIAELLGTMGILGILTYFLVIGMFFAKILCSKNCQNWKVKIANLFGRKWFTKKGRVSGVQVLTKNQKIEPKDQTEINSDVKIPLVLGFLALFIAQFFYYQNITLAFCFWFFLSLAVARNIEISEYRKFSFKDFPELGLVLNAVFWILIFGIAFCYFTMGKFYLADYYYRNYLLQTDGDIEFLEKATKLWESNAFYHNILARAYLEKISQEFTKTQPDIQVISNTASLAVEEAKKSERINERSIATQETLGVVYRDIQGLAQGALEWGIKYFEKALTLEPKNPVLLTELGKLYLLTQESNRVQKAKDSLNKALTLRPNFIDATLQLALLEESEGKTGEAKARLENLVQQNPLSVETHFQLGRLYYNEKEYEKAIGEFSTALQIFPNHSNSLFSLGMVYQQQGKKDLALQYFEKVLELNLGNQDVMQRIEELRE